MSRARHELLGDRCHICNRPAGIARRYSRKGSPKAALPDASHRSGCALSYEGFFNVAINAWSICAYSSSVAV